MLPKLKYPIIQAPMAGGFTTVDLVTAVSNAGGLGSLGAAFTMPNDLRKAIQEIKSKTQNPFNINLFTSAPPKVEKIQEYWAHVASLKKPFAFAQGALAEVPYYQYQKQIEVVLQEKVPVLSFTFDTLAKEYVDALKKNKTCVIGTATHIDEVLVLTELGVDAIVCQGKEAGGHRSTFIGNPKNALIPTMDLIQQAKRVTKIPLIAAGGIMTREDIEHALAAGATLVQMGTAFLTCKEAGTPPLHRKALLEYKQRRAVLTLAFSGRWARAIENSFIKEMAPFEKDVPAFPLPIFLLAEMRKEATNRGDFEYLPFWAGECFSKCVELSVNDLIKSLTAEKVVF